MYDVQLPLDGWQPSAQELRVLSGMMCRLAQGALPLRRLEVPQQLALEMFADNEFKRSQVPNIAQLSESGEWSR